MKKRIAFVLVGILVCVGAAVWLVPYTPMPDMDGFWNVRIWRVNGADMTELTEQVNQTALREVMTQVQAKRVPRSQSSFSMDKVSYEIIAVYNDTPTFLPSVSPFHSSDSCPSARFTIFSPLCSAICTVCAVPPDRPS